MVIYGYKLTGTTDIRDVDMVLSKVKNKIQSITNGLYGELLGSEIAIICDNISLNVLHRHDDTPIALVAKEALDKKLKTAALINATTKYNLSVYVNVLYHEDDVYFKVVCSNPRLTNAFHIKELKDCSLSESECKDQANPKTILWSNLHAAQKEHEPLSVNLTATPEYSKEKIKFPTVKERAHTHARHQITNRLLNQLGGGEQIPPHLLMPYIDQALEMITTDSSLSYELGEKTVHLEQIFLHLEKQEHLLFGEKQKVNRL